ncbi:hypothetical protein OOJ91_34130 [Micromonospora lupini]|uniref:hypothetical protein n=1 Tax=Micromonospora lupini TaxID=285679 RepID=UPI0022589211|nr:hypothetical protein [Micromonospora lupini]MCX5070888.1 hypothetical protein [Micromonospora lupini]
MTLTKRHRTAALAAAGVLALTALFGCDNKLTEPFNDAPRSKVENSTPADLITFPDGFSNAATKCDHGNRIYSAYHGDSPYAAITVVPNDPTCNR